MYPSSQVHNSLLCSTLKGFIDINSLKISMISTQSTHSINSTTPNEYTLPSRAMLSSQITSFPATMTQYFSNSQRHSETTQTTEFTAASIDRGSKRRDTFPQTKNIVFALERPKEAHSVRECQARVPAGVHSPHGQHLSVVMPIIEEVAVPTSG